MTIREFENKCAILAQTPQERWYDLRFKAFAIMTYNSDIKLLDISDLFPGITKLLGLIVACVKVENKYYFWITVRSSTTTQCFNVETINFIDYPYILSSQIILSSDDDSNRVTFMPVIMHNMTKPELKTKLDALFSK